MADLTFLAKASAVLHDYDVRRRGQQHLVDDLIAQARKDGASRAEIMEATGYRPRSLQLALRRIEARQA